MPSLQALVYTNSLTAPVLKERLGKRISNVRLLWELHGGLRSIELDWVGTKVEAYAFYEKYMGYRLIIADHFCDMPVADGNITGLSLSPTGVHILANGVWWRHYDQMYAFDDTVQDSQQGTITYEANGEFRDTGQNFSDWSTDSGDAVYKIEVGNLGSYQGTDGTLDNDNDFATSGGGTAREWYGQRFIPETGANVGQVSFQLKKTNTPTGTLTVSVYDEASGRPGTQIGNASDTVDITTLTTSYTWIDFTWSDTGPALSAGTPYFAVLKTASYTEDADTVSVGTDGDGDKGDVFFQYNGGASIWAVVSTDAAANYRIYPDSTATISWGFMGSVGAGGNDYIKVYRDYAQTYLGWLGESPTNKTPIRYAVLKAFAYKTTDEIIEDALTEEVPAISSDQTNIDSTGTVIGFWAPPLDEGGMYPGEIIEKMASLSDSSNTQWNYWVRNLPFEGITPQKPIPYFKAQVNDGSYNWQIHRWMLTSGTMTMERNLQELRNYVRVIYRNMDEDDALTITDVASNSDSISDYWQREAIISGGDLFDTGADQYRDLYLTKFQDALLGKGLVITAPYILDDQGTKWPLWYPIKACQSYFQVRLFTDANLFTKSWDRKQVSQATTMEYDDARGSLRIVLDLSDDRLDALLSRISAFR